MRLHIINAGYFESFIIRQFSLVNKKTFLRRMNFPFLTRISSIIKKVGSIGDIIFHT